MSNIVYEASVYTREVSYKDFKGVEKTMQLHFALDPLELMRVIATFQPKKVKSGNPALAGKEAPIDESTQLKFLHDLAVRAAGAPSDDGEYWEVFPDFSDSLAGKAFLTKLTASDKDREEFAEKVILDPFRAFVQYAEADSSNTPSDVQQFKVMLGQMENIFSMEEKNETVDDRRARLVAEMAALDAVETVNPQPLPPSDS